MDNDNTMKMTNKTKWSVDTVHSHIGFKVKHLMIAHVKGFFSAFDASIYTTHRDFSTAAIDVWIEAASVYTGNADRDEHLKSEHFLDASHHKMVTFISGSMELPDTKGVRALWGELTIKGVTKKIQLWVEFGGMHTDARGVEKAGFAVTGTIHRSDWGLSWNTSLEAGGILVGEDVAISCELELVNMGDRGGRMELEPGKDTPLKR
jgi:polyisoprenoid-binding protein YceI